MLVDPALGFSSFLALVWIAAHGDMSHISTKHVREISS
jgi:hypothetical protein